MLWLACGWASAFGSENLIQGLNCVKNSINSYTIDQLAILAGVAAVEDGDYFAQRCAQVAATRDRTSETLRELGFTVLPSKSNFIFITHPELPARKLFADLREAGILVRYFALPRIDNFLRVTIGSEEEMAEFCADDETICGERIMRYEGMIYRPPGEWKSYLLQCTIGCSNNTCTFCSMYKEKRFRVRPLKDILDDIEMARKAYGNGVRRCSCAMVTPSS